MLSQKHYICDGAKTLSYEDKVAVLTLIKQHDASKIKTFPDGSRIDLSKLPDSVIKNIFDITKKHTKAGITGRSASD